MINLVILLIKHAGDILAVACRACDTDGKTNNGKVTIYELNNEDQWKMVGAPIPGEGEQDGGDGIFIDIDSLGNTIIIGSPDNSDDGENEGPNPSGGSVVGRGHVKILDLFLMVGLSWEEILMVRVLVMNLEGMCHL